MLKSPKLASTICNTTLLYIKYSKLHPTQHSTTLLQAKYAKNASITGENAHIFITLDAIASALCTTMPLDLLDNKLYD
jgi:hypothetical protein